MILPIAAYGSEVLRKETKPVEKNFAGLHQLIADMYETMYAANGVGLAAPQVNHSIQFFITDGKKLDKSLATFKKVFINPKIISREKEKVNYEEGCLSIPNIREEILRPDKIRVGYYDENWNEHEEDFSGLEARIIQHECDHLHGVLFTDYLSSFKKYLLKSKLQGIARGNVEVDYPMFFPKKKVKVS